MKKLLLVVSIALASLTAQAINVNPTSTINQNFGGTPAAGDWATLASGGNAGSITDAAGLDAAAQTLSASGITTVLTTSGTTPPSANNLARRNTTRNYLQTRPQDASSQMVVLMATLTNNAGTDLSALTISYTFGLEVAAGATLAEEVPGWRVYYSLTGAAGSWTLIPALTTDTPARLRTTLNLGNWPAGSRLFLLFLDDNGSGADTGTANVEGAYFIDDFSASPISEPISFGASGTGTETFAVFPAETRWSTLFAAGGATDIPDAAAMDAAVNTLSATNIQVALGSSASVNPPTANEFGRWNSVNLNVQTRTTGARASGLMATIRNDSGGPVSAVSISYNLSVAVEAGSTILEDIPAHRVYYSLTGEPGSWNVINDLSNDTPGIHSTVVNIGSWTPGSLLYILWADDNGAGGTTAPGTLEGAYSIDDVTVDPAAMGVTITNPDNGSSFPQGVPVPVSAAALMAGTVTNVQFIDSVAGSLTNISAPPFSFVYENPALGVHNLTAVAKDSLGNTANSTAVQFTVVANNPPTVTITNPPAATNVLVGSLVAIGAAAADTDGSVARVEFYLDGVLWTTDLSSPYSFEYANITAGAHTVSAVAVDNGNFRSATNSISVTATNPPGVTVIIPNSSTWKYFDQGTDPGATWNTLGYDDSAWAEGVAELGYGDGPGRPERTVVSFGPSAAAKYPTTYFRKTFNVSNPGTFSGLDLRTMVDDHFIVYINGVEVFRDMTNAVITFTTLEQPAIAHDGTVYTNVVLSSSVLNNGANVVAVEVHQDSAGSTDISFDLMLWGVAPAGPSLTITRLNATQAEISWPISGGSEQLYYKDTLDAATWTLETATDTPSGGSHHVIVNTTGSTRFWALRN